MKVGFQMVHLVTPLAAFETKEGDSFYVIEPNTTFEDVLFHLVKEASLDLEDGVNCLKEILDGFLEEESV